MEINHILNENLTATITVNISESDYNAEFTKVIKDYKRKAAIPGFRQGHVPDGMIRKMYGEMILADIVGKMLGEELEKYIEDQKFKTLGQPLPLDDEENYVDFKTMKDFQFKYELGLKPDFELEIDEKIKLDEYKIEITDDSVEKYLTDIRRRFGTMVEADIISEDDTIYGDIAEVDSDGNIVENGINKEHTFLGINYIKLKGVKSDIMKMHKGDSYVFNPAKAFKQDYELSYFLGIGLEAAKSFKADVKFTLTDIKHYELAELNQDLFDRVYEHSDIESEEQLRERILRDITESYKNESRNQLMNDLVDHLVKETNLSLPDEFMKRWILESNRREKEHKPITAEELEIEYNNYRDSLRWQIIEGYLLEKYQLHISMDEIRSHVAKLIGFDTIGDDDYTKNVVDQVTDSVLKNEQQYKQIVTQLSENKVIDLIKEKAKIKEKSISYEDFIAMVSEKATK